jgi:hypothetical protein
MQVETVVLGGAGRHIPIGFREVSFIQVRLATSCDVQPSQHSLDMYLHGFFLCTWVANIGKYLLLGVAFA